MSRQHHLLKTETRFYQDVESGKKKFELRKNDRNFQVYDFITLLEVVNGEPTGRQIPGIEIKYILHGGIYGLAEDHCIMCW